MIYKGPVLRGDIISTIKWSTDLCTFIVESRRHIQAPTNENRFHSGSRLMICRPMSLVLKSVGQPLKTSFIGCSNRQNLSVSICLPMTNR